MNVLEKAQSDSLNEQQYNRFQRIEKRLSRIAAVKVASTIDSYREKGREMTFIQLTGEKHSSRNLGRMLRASGHARPGLRWEAHHIVSGKHPESVAARALLADEDISIRIDDPDNGCWMPKTKVDARPTLYPNAIGHNRIHRELYYTWLSNTLSAINSEGGARSFLNTVRAQLLHGNIRDNMVLQEEIDKVEYKDWLKKNH